MQPKLASVLTILAFLVASGAMFADESPNDVEAWKKAEQKFKEYYQTVDPDLHYGIFKSRRLEKFLPDWRVYVHISEIINESPNLFLVNRDGTVRNLGNSQLVEDLPTRSFQVKPIAQFVKSQAIKVTSENDAVEVAKLFEELQNASNYIGFLKINTRDFTVFDKEFMEGSYGPRKDYRYTPHAVGNGWIVVVEYIGRPAAVQEPPIYRIELDDNDRFQNIMRLSQSPQLAFPKKD